jgi:very-short-patch-repair endonuclease
MCSSSLGEITIIDWLIFNNVEFKPQYSFHDLKGFRKKIPLRFDFYIPSINLLCEYDGIIHYKPTRFNRDLSEEEIVEAFEIQKYNDSLKNEYCLKNNIPLLRISYKEIKNITEILTANILKR